MARRPQALDALGADARLHPGPQIEAALVTEVPSVLFVAGEYPPAQGGLGDYTRELGRALVSEGVACRVLTLAAPGASTEEVGVADEPPVSRAVRKWDWRAWRRVRDAAAKADIVHIQYQTAAYGMHPVANALPWLLRREHIPVVSTYHDTRIPYLFPKAGKVRDWVTLALARSSDYTIATNNEDAAVLRPAARRLAVIPIGSNIAPTATPADGAAWRAQRGIGPDAPLLVYFGFVNRAKGADILVDTLARLHAAGSPARLLMLGGQVGASDPTNQAFLAETRAQADRLGVSDAMVWTDFLPEAEVSAALMAADIAVLPYRGGVSLQRGTLMAALAHGVPILATRPVNPTPGPLPGLTDGVDAVLVPPEQPEALANAIVALLGDPQRRARLGEGARALAARFRWDNIARQHIEVYRAVLSMR
ncbi:MAG: glycosyltransferase [Anaerolineae bacterium]